MVDSTDALGSPGSPSRVCAALCGVLVIVLLLLCASVASADDPVTFAEQTDWSGGPQSNSTVDAWESEFQSSEGVAWLATSEQVTLSSQPLPSPVRYRIASDAQRPAGLAAGDIDKDGLTDLAAATIGGHEVVWLRNSGQHPEAWYYHVLDEHLLGASSVAIRDVDGNGFEDVVACGWDSGEVIVWRNIGWGDTWVKQVVATGFGNAHWVDTADVDGDGHIDILGAAADPGEIAWWRNDGGDTPQWTMHIVDPDFGGARSAVPVDLDQDGRIDILGTALVDNEVAWWRNQGGDPITWSKFTISSAFSLAHHATAGDIDLDGDPDVVGAGYGAGRVTMWINQGGDPIQWSPRPLGTPFTGALVVGIADLDGDNRLDVAATSDRLDRVSWWRNTDDNPATWDEYLITDDFPNAWPLVVADLDHNGSLDVAAGASGGTDIAWWVVADFAESGTLVSTPVAVDTDIVSLVCSTDAQVPAGSSLNIEFRVGYDPDEMGAWRAIEPGRPVAVHFQGPGLLQYRIDLSTSSSEISPIVRTIRFDWSTELVPPRRPGGRRNP